MKSILVAADLSAHSDRAIERGLRLAADRGARLTILHVVDERQPEAGLERAAIRAREEIDGCLSKLGSVGKAEVVIVDGREHRDILDMADELNADVILVPGTSEGWDNPLKDTTLEKLLRKCDRPLLVISDRVAGAYSKAVVGIDFSDFSMPALKTALAVAPSADVHAVHAFHVPFEGLQGGDETRRQMKAEQEAQLKALVDGSGAGAAGGRVHLHVENGEVQSVLSDALETIKPDLVVLGTHGRSGIAHALLGSVAESFLMRRDRDVLVVKA